MAINAEATIMLADCPIDFIFCSFVKRMLILATSVYFGDVLRCNVVVDCLNVKFVVACCYFHVFILLTYCMSVISLLPDEYLFNICKAS